MVDVCMLVTAPRERAPQVVLLPLAISSPPASRPQQQECRIKLRQIRRVDLIQGNLTHITLQLS